MTKIESIAAKYGHQVQNDAVGKFNEGEWHKLLTQLGIAQRKLDEAKNAKIEVERLRSKAFKIFNNLQGQKRETAKIIYLQYKNLPKL